MWTLLTESQSQVYLIIVFSMPRMQNALPCKRNQYANTVPWYTREINLNEIYLIFHSYPFRADWCTDIILK